MNDANIFGEMFHSEINRTIRLSIFTSCMKKADVTPMYKQKDQSIMDNYHGVNILPNLSKVFERCLCN